MDKIESIVARIRDLRPARYYGHVQQMLLRDRGRSPAWAPGQSVMRSAAQAPPDGSPNSPRRIARLEAERLGMWGCGGGRLIPVRGTRGGTGVEEGYYDTLQKIAHLSPMGPWPSNTIISIWLSLP